MWFLLITALFASFQTKSIAQFNPGAKQISMSNSDVALSNDVFSLFNNPAGLSQMNWRELGIYYSPSPFGFSELANGFFAYHEPFDFGSIGLGAMTYGFELYRENKIAIGFSYLTQNFRLGFSVQNLNRASFGNEKDNIPMVFNTGFSYEVMEELTFNLAVEKDIRYNYSLRGGIEYNLLEYISLRSGFSNEPSRYSAGIGINYSYFSLDYAFFTHMDLGLTHQAGLVISFGSQGNRK